MRRVVVAVVAAVGLALVAGGCGSGSDDPGRIVRAASAKTAAAQSSRIALTMVTSGGGADGTVTATGTVAFDPARGSMTMDMSGIPGAEGFTTMEAVFEGTVFYMKFPPAIAAEIPGGKPWVKFDLRTIGREAGIDFGQLMQASQSDPTQALQYLDGASDDIAEVGKAKVRGVDTTHYRGTIDLKKAAAGREGAQRDALERAIDLIGTDTMPVDAWIDDDGRARKIRYTQDLSKAEGGATGTVDVTFEMFDFGVDVDATPPPADQVVDLAALLGGGKAG